MIEKIFQKLKNIFKSKKRFKAGQQIYVIENVIFVRQGKVKQTNKDNVLVEIRCSRENYEKWFPIQYCFTKRQYDKYEKERKRELEKLEKQRKIDRRKVKKIVDSFNTEEPLIKKLRTER